MSDASAAEPRRPRLWLTYPEDDNGTVREVHLPFVVGVLADLSADGEQNLPPLRDRVFRPFDRDSLDSLMAEAAPALAFTAPHVLGGEDGAEFRVSLTFRSLADFDPPAVAAQIPALAGARPDDPRVAAQLDAVLHHPKFQALEGTWRGLAYLARSTTTGEYLRLRVLNASREAVLRDVRDAGEFVRSELYRKVYAAEFTRAGGTPYGLLVADYAIGDYRYGVYPLDMKIRGGVAEGASDTVIVVLERDGLPAVQCPSRSAARANWPG